MRRFTFILITLISGQTIFGQIQPVVAKISTKYDSCFQEAKELIEKETEFQFDKSPLEWAQFQIDSNLLRIDTFSGVKNHTIYFINKSNSLFLIKTISTEQRNWSKKISVYDNGGNLILKESYSDSGSLVFRRRRGYIESIIQFECNYHDTPLYRFIVFSKRGAILRPNVDICECNF